MNLKTPAMFGMAVLVVASGMVGFNFATMFPTQKASTEGLPFLGHVEVVAQDQNGEIKAYRQSDNVVMRIGKTCASDLLFGENTTTSCAGSTRFQHIGIGNNSTAPSEGQTGPQIGLIGPLRSIDTAVGLDNATATVGAKATIDKAFTINGTDTVRIVGLFDTGGTSDTVGHAFAKQQLGSAIPVSSGDTVTVKWTITVG